MFAEFADKREIDKDLVLSYKTMLGERYAVSAANSMIAALNTFFRFCRWSELIIKQFRVQREMFCSEEKELTKAEYMRLLQAATKKKNQRLALSDCRQKLYKPPAIWYNRNRKVGVLYVP